MGIALLCVRWVLECLSFGEAGCKAAIGYESASHQPLTNHTAHQDASSTFCAALRRAGCRKGGVASVAWPDGLTRTGSRGRSVHTKDTRGKGVGPSEVGLGRNKSCPSLLGVDFPWEIQ